jgi:predicted membrane-bound spermidine synthase
MSLKSLFVPEIVKTFHSDFNGEIKLIRFVNEYRLDAGGLTQSGSVMVWIWSAAIRNLLPKNYSPQNILLLGLGGGSALFWLRRRFPKAHLTAIEIDPLMIDLAKKYFKVDKIKNLKIVNADAVEFIKNTKDKYSLILMDCYQGYTTPAGFEDIRVLKKMKQLGETVLINRLYWDDLKLATDEFVTKLSPHFRIKSVYTASNLVISLL